jgi:hypothetical protein
MLVLKVERTRDPIRFLESVIEAEQAHPQIRTQAAGLLLPYLPYRPV